LDGAGPAASPGGLMDAERAPKQELPVLRHADLQELAGLRRIGDLRGHQCQRVVDPGAPHGEHLAPSPDHGVPPDAPIARTGTVSSAEMKRSPAAGLAAWYSCSGTGTCEPERRASIPWTAARIPGTVVMHGTPARTASVRMNDPSVRGPRPNGVLITRSTRPAAMRSSAFGEPSDRFRTGVTRTPALAIRAAVPLVASISNPSSARRRAG